jgi:cytochrome P450
VLELIQHPALQARLRTETRSLPLRASTGADAPLDADTLAALEKLPLLDAVLREALRVHPPVLATMRMATRDAVVGAVRRRRGYAEVRLCLCLCRAGRG